MLDWSTRYAAYEAVLQATLGSQAAGVQILATEYNSVSYQSGQADDQPGQRPVRRQFVGQPVGQRLQRRLRLGPAQRLGHAATTTATRSTAGARRRLRACSAPPAQPAGDGPYVAYPGYYALQLASKIIVPGGEVVSATSNYSDLDVYAVVEPDGDLDLLVVNTNPAAAITDQISVTGFQPGGPRAGLAVR